MVSPPEPFQQANNKILFFFSCGGGGVVWCGVVWFGVGWVGLGWVGVGWSGVHGLVMTVDSKEIIHCVFFFFRFSEIIFVS